MTDKNNTKSPAVDKPICFVIMPFTDPDGYEKGHFRKIYEQLFFPAIEMAGSDPHRVDDEVESNMIHGKLLNQLVTAPMVLCDLSSKNPNVLYELGIRHAFDLPVVLVQETGQSHIFDIGGITTIDYRKNRLYDEVVEDQKKIANAITQTASTKKNYSIMSLAQMEPAKFNKSDKITKEDRIEIMIGELSHKVGRIESQLANQSKANCFPTEITASTPTIKGRIRLGAEGRLQYAMKSATDILRNNSRDQSTVSTQSIIETRNILRRAIDEYERYVSSSDMALIEAQFLLKELRDLNADQLEPATV